MLAIDTGMCSSVSFFIISKSILFLLGLRKNSGLYSKIWELGKYIVENEYPTMRQGIVVDKVCYLSEFLCDSKRAMSSAILASLSAFSATSLALV